MSLRLKVTIFVLVTAVIIVAVIFAISHFVFINSFQQIEEKNACEMVTRATNTLSDQLESLHKLNRDWAAWDDAYAFIQNPQANADFQSVNLGSSTFSNNSLNFVLIIDSADKILYGRGYDLNAGIETDIPQSLRQLVLNKKFLYHRDVNDSRAGIILIPEGPVMISSQPVITSKGQGPVRGTFIMARFIDDNMVKHLSDTLRMSLSVVRVDDKMPDAVKKVGLSLSTANSVLAAADNEQTISGYSLLQDIYDQPALILKVDMPRKISEMGAMTAGYFLIALLAFAVLYAVLLNFALSRLVITRIERMGKFVNYVSLSGDLTTSLAVESKDEISQLQSNINRMIGKLRDSQEALSKDIQERERMRQRLVEMATHDYLTGLPNRLLLSDRFIVAAAQTHRNKASLAILSLDLDRFKAVNDTLGHDAGDHVLRAVSTRLSGITRASDTLARVGGDEFILLTQNAEDMKDINVIAQKILDSFAEPLIVDNAEVDLSTSIGIALYPQDGEDLDTLIKKSDASLYYAKGHGRNQFKFFADGDVRVGRVFRSTA